MIYKIGFVICLGASITACSYRFTQNAITKNIALDPSYKNDTLFSAFIAPYSDSLSKQMNEVIGKSNVNFIVLPPSSNLLNWSADALFSQETKNIKLEEPVFCLLNAGGLRAGLNAGNITVGDVYRMMPFDNMVAWARMPIEQITEIASFLQSNAGVALSNANFKNGKLNINGLLSSHTHFWIISSDYLIQGGDKMAFFQKASEISVSQKLLRDQFIAEVKLQGTLVENLENRFAP